MSGWLQGIFTWLDQVARQFFSAAFEGLSRVRWFLVTVALLVLTVWESVVGILFSLSLSFAQVTGTMVQKVSSAISSANSASGGVSAALGLANCVLPISESLAAAAVMMTVWLSMLVCRMVLAIYRLIPFKAS